MRIGVDDQNEVEMITYSMTDGSMVHDEYTFITSLEWFDDDSEVVRLTRQRWVLAEKQDGAYYPPTNLLCPDCHGDGEDDAGARCSKCSGTGDDPMSGAGFVIEEADPK